MDDFKINLTRDIDLSRALVLVSFPTIGNVSSIATNYFSQSGRGLPGGKVKR